MSKPKPEPQQLQTIDPVALSKVSGGAGSSGSDPAVMQALTGILDSIKSLASNQTQSGFGPTEMMMMMMMMGGRNNSAAQVVAPANPYAGYTIDGVFYPFNK